jgi:hypothetical protein
LDSGSDADADVKKLSDDDDHEFNFQAHRSELNKIFFRDEDLIVRFVYPSQ